MPIADNEDDTLASGSINADEVIIEFRYIGRELNEMEAGEKYTPAAFGIFRGKRLIGMSDCRACHMPNRDLISPSFMAIFDRYKKNGEAIGRLVKTDITGGLGRLEFSLEFWTRVDGLRCEAGRPVKNCWQQPASRPA